MHRLFIWLDEEVWRHIEPFCVPLEQERALKPLNQPPTPSNKWRKNVMTTAYVLLNTEIGAEKQVLKALKGIDGVEEAHSLWGVYDIIANIKADNMQELKDIITNRIEAIGQINSKLTMIISEHAPLAFSNHKPLEEQVVFEREPIPIFA